MALPGMSAPMAFLASELQSDNVAQCILCLSRLRVIGLALGAEKARSELIPFLTKEIEDPDGKFTDEVKVIVAEVLGLFVEFVGGPSEAHCLLPPLLVLCKAEESTVRDQSVNSINAIGKKLSKKQLQDHLYPAFQELAKNFDWFTPRVSACGLCALLYSAWCGDEDALPKEVVATFCTLGEDEAPMVRRAAAAKLAEVAGVLQKEHLNTDSSCKMVATHLRLINDEQESVRVNAVKAIPALCQRIVVLGADPALMKKVLEHFDIPRQDKSWRVRNACADLIAEVATSCKSLPDTHAKLKESYLSLANDTECEVRIATALKGDVVAAALGPTFGAEEVFKIVHNLVSDPNSASRVELAQVLAKLAAPLGKAHTEELILGSIDIIASSEQENMNVRLAVINQFEGIIDVVGLQSQPLLKSLIKKLGSVDGGSGEKKWRIRHAIVLLLPKLAVELGAQGLSETVNLSECLSSEFSLIRSDFATLVLPELTRILGAPWLIEMLPLFNESATHKAYQLNSVILFAMVALIDYLDDDAVASAFVPRAIEFATHPKAPNLRIKAVQSLGEVGANVPAQKDKILATLTKVAENDDDVDVKMFATEAVRKCG